MTTSHKQRRTRAQWSELLRRYRTSGQSQIAFCNAHDVPISSFTTALRRARDAQGEGVVQAPFASVVLDEVNRADVSGQRWDIELSLGADVVLRLRRS